MTPNYTSRAQIERMAQDMKEFHIRVSKALDLVGVRVVEVKRCENVVTIKGRVKP